MQKESRETLLYEMSPYCLRLICLFAVAEATTEQQRATPQPANGDDRVDDTGDEHIRSAENPRDQIKLEQTDQSPVECADDDQCQRDLINDLQKKFLLFIIWLATIIMSRRNVFYSTVFQ